MDFRILITKSKENDETAMMDIINAFSPFIEKYYIKSKYNEEVKSELILKLIRLIKHELKFDRMLEINNNVLMSYILKSLCNHYIYISRKQSKIAMTELNLFDSNLEGSLSLNESSYEFFQVELMKFLLTQKEFECVYKHIFFNETIAEIAGQMNISRQACNKYKNHAFEKLRKYFLTHL